MIGSGGHIPAPDFGEVVMPKNPDQLFPESNLVFDNIQTIFQYFKFQELDICNLVSKDWSRLAAFMSKYAVFQKFAFNPAHWNEFLSEGNVNVKEMGRAYRELPNNIYQILKSPCPAFPGKRIMDTHVLVWIPESVNGKKLNIKNFGEMLKLWFPYSKSGYRHFTREILERNGSISIEPGFRLMTADVILNSRNKNFENQKKLVKNLNENNHACYKVPKVGEAVVCIMANYLRSEYFLFGALPDWTYTSCEERVEDYQIIVGGFFSAGLAIKDYYHYNETIGVAAIWPLSRQRA